MKPISALHRMRTSVSDDSRIAKFFLLLKGGQNFVFSVPFAKLGLLMNAIKDLTRQMSARLLQSDAANNLEVANGLSDSMYIVSITSGRDEETGDKLIWIETETDGCFAFHLTDCMQQELKTHLDQEQSEIKLKRKNAARN